MRIPLLIIVATLVAGCDGSRNDRNTKETAATPPADSAPAQALPAVADAPTVTDPQIAAIVVAANDVDIAAGRLAATRAHNSEVKAFARQMITDHSAVNKAATDLVTKLKVKPEPNQTSQQLTQGGAQNRQALQEKRDSAFDRAYIDNEVIYHQTVLDAIDQTLVPNAQNAELKALLEQTRPAIAAHLQHAEKIQSSLKP
jgi:putative membrane protein